MKSPIKIYFFLIPVFIHLHHVIYAGDWKMILGYQAGKFSNGMRNYDNELFRLNHFGTGQTSEPLTSPFLFHGLVVGFGWFPEPSEKLYVSWEWSNRHQVARGSRRINQKNADLALKVRHNNLSLGTFGFRISNRWGVFVSPVEFGSVKILYKNTEEEPFTSWNDYYNVEKGLLSDYTCYGYSLGADAFLANRFRLRLQVYRCWNSIGLRSRNDILTDYHYNPSSVSLSLVWLAGKTE